MGSIVRLIANKDQYSLLDEEAPRNINGNVLKPVKEVLENIVDDCIII